MICDIFYCLYHKKYKTYPIILTANNSVAYFLSLHNLSDELE